jgi:hypothetical protein
MAAFRCFRVRTGTDVSVQLVLTSLELLELTCQRGQFVVGLREHRLTGEALRESAMLDFLKS